MKVFLLLLAFIALIIAVNLLSPSKKVKFRLKTKYTIRDPEFINTVDALFGAPLTAGNRITPLANGDQFFPAMLAALADAQRSITLETFIYWAGDVGEKFSRVIAERAKAGVKCHVLLDWLGSRRFERHLLETMRDAGVSVHFYHPVHWFNLRRMNRRTHRKILVIDGRVGFTGGAGISDEWSGNGLQRDRWRDNHYRVEGPVVAQLQAAFIDNWTQTRPDILHGDDYFPWQTNEKLGLSQAPGTQLAQVFKSSSKEGASSARLLFLYSISVARRSIDVASAYFIPDKQAKDELIKAHRRGVRVRVIVPGFRNDSHIVRKAAQATWGALLQRGIEIYSYQPAMYHNKLLIVDGVWTSVGSANFDPRSFRLNDEVNLNVYDPDFADQMTASFNADLARCEALSYEMWRARGWLETSSDNFCALFKSQF